MLITDNAVVSMDYVLKDDSGEVIDSSEGGEPLAYLHGSGVIIPGLEKELDGKKAGDAFDVTIQPADGYGEQIDELRQEVALEEFKDVEDLKPGMQFQVESDDGVIVITVIEVGKDKVLVDGNHPLAGMVLHFAITVRDVREATKEEIEHGHAHGPGGHEHDH